MPLALIRRLVKGSPLTATEHDTNLNVLEAGIAASLQPGQAIPSDVECRNNSGVGLTAGAPVYITSSSGTKPTVALADASSESTAARSLGLVVATVSNNADCVVRTHGILTGVNTATLTEGLAVWLSETTGQLTSTRPTQPAHGVFFGFCVKQAAGTAGILYINVINGLELAELHDVLLTGAATDDVLALASDGLWKKRTLGSAAAAAITDFAPAAQGVTNGNSHNHDGGDGAQIAYGSLSGLPTLGGAAALDVGTTDGTVAAGDAPAAAITALKAEANPLPQYTQVEIGVACSDESTALTAGTAKVTFRLPYAMTLMAVRANVKVAPTGSALVVDINESGTSVLSTKLSIDATEKTSTTAATAAVISDSTLADDAEITIDIDQIGATIAGAGLKVWLIGRRA